MDQHLIGACFWFTIATLLILLLIFGKKKK